ncbi:MAG: iron-containing alcohol dehydrogenase, partial [Christensenellaceae bacterium]
LALKAISMIFDNLKDSYDGNMEARGKMHIAQCLAGMAFSNALLGICHSLAHKIGAQFNIPHGCCNAILLPYVIKYNAKTNMADFARIAREVGLPGATDKQLTDSLIQAVQELNQAVGIAPTLRENGVTDELFNAHIDFIAEQAQLDPCTGSNPRATTPADLKAILVCAMDGKPLTI